MLIRLFYPLAWVMVRLPELPGAVRQAWSTAKFIAAARRNSRYFYKKYGTFENFLESLDGESHGG